MQLPTTPDRDPFVPPIAAATGVSDGAQFDPGYPSSIRITPGSQDPGVVVSDPCPTRSGGRFRDETQKIPYALADFIGTRMKPEQVACVVDKHRFGLPGGRDHGECVLDRHVAIEPAVHHEYGSGNSLADAFGQRSEHGEVVVDPCLAKADRQRVMQQAEDPTQLLRSLTEGVNTRPSRTAIAEFCHAQDTVSHERWSNTRNLECQPATAVEEPRAKVREHEPAQ